MSAKPNTSSQNIFKNNEDKLLYSNIPGLKEAMLCPNYWTQSKEVSKVIMSKQEIEAYNKISEETVVPIVDLENHKKFFTKQELSVKINHISSYSNSERFHEDGKLVSEEYYNKLKENCNIENLLELNNISYGVTTSKTVMRTFPTFDKVFKTGDNYEFDRFQETAVYPIEPLVILLSSKDSKWYFAQMYNYLAWIPKQDVVIAKKEELFNYLKTEDFIVTTGKRVFTNFNPLNKQLSEVRFDMGIKIPLANVKEIEEDIYGQNSVGNYVVKLPTKNNNGNLEFKLALIAKNEEINLGYLPYTSENIIYNTFKFLGERYGWGGTFNSRDCASLVLDVYRTMGFKIPRNAEEQGELAVGTFYEMKEDMKINGRKEILNNLKPGSTVYSSGHVMIYLGTENGLYYVIHDFSGFYKPEQDGNLKYYKVREVMVSPLSIISLEDGKTYIEELYGAKDFVIKN